MSMDRSCTAVGSLYAPRYVVRLKGREVKRKEENCCQTRLIDNYLLESLHTVIWYGDLFAGSWREKGGPSPKNHVVPHVTNSVEAVTFPPFAP